MEKGKAVLPFAIFSQENHYDPGFDGAKLSCIQIILNLRRDTFKGLERVLKEEGVLEFVISQVTLIP